MAKALNARLLTLLAVLLVAVVGLVPTTKVAAHSNHTAMTGGE